MYQPAPQPIYPPPKKNNTGKIIAGVVGVLFVLALIVAATGSNSSTKPVAAPKPAPASGVAAPPPPAPASIAAPQTTWSDAEIADNAYLLTLRSSHIHYASDAAAIRLAHDVCTALGAGNSEQAVGVTIMNSGYSAEDAGTIVGAAEAGYCRNH